jgi:nicotinamidase-related amidase
MTNSMKPLPPDTVLLVIDVQQAFNDPRWGTRNNPGAEASIASLLERWRHDGRPVIHIQHRNPAAGSLFNPDGPGVRVKDEAAPLVGEPVLYKRVNSSFIGTDLEARLRAMGATTLVITGMTTDHCVSTTTRMAGNLDFTAIIVSDATATFDRRGPDGRYYSAEMMHDTALVSLSGEFATVATTAEVLAAL